MLEFECSWLRVRGICRIMAEGSPLKRTWGIKMKKRILSAGIFLALFVVECLIALYVHDRLVRPYVGDMLVVVLLYFFVRILFPEGIRLLPLWIFLFAAAVEASQYFHLAALLGVEHIRAARLILGATFDWKDIGCYGIGCLLLAGMEYLAKHGRITLIGRSRNKIE